MCNRRIDPGEKYMRGAGFDGSTAWSWKECGHCEAIQSMYDVSWDGEYSYETFDGWAESPRDLQELRHVAGWRMRWRTRSGALLPIPTRTADNA